MVNVNLLKFDSEHFPLLSTTGKLGLRILHLFTAVSVPVYPEFVGDLTITRV